MQGSTVVPNAATQWRESDITRRNLDDDVDEVVTIWGRVVVGALPELSDAGRLEIMERQGA